MIQQNDSVTLSFLRNSEPFSALSHDALTHLLPLLESVAAPTGAAIIRQGDVGEKLFLVLSGKLQVVDERSDRPSIILTQKLPGQAVGEISLLTREPRTASVYALADTQLLTLSDEALTRLGERAPASRDEIINALTLRAQKTRMQHIIRLVTLFEGLTEEVMQDLEHELELISAPGGSIVVRQGDPSDALYLVIGGRLSIIRQDESQPDKHLMDISRGQTVGEIGLITGEERTATIIATRDTLLAKLSSDGFERLLEKHPRLIMERIVGPIIQRLQSQLAGESRRDGIVSAIAIVAIDESVPTATFAMLLADSLADLGSTMHLNSARCDQLLQSEGMAQIIEADPRNAGFVLWLSERESQHQYVVYEADPDLTPWTQRCVRQADQILILAWADSSAPVLSDIEKRLLEDEPIQNVPQKLILLQDSGALLPRGTKDWLASRNVVAHYHVRLEKAGDLARLARLLVGRGVGLVLSGGGARGFSHIGVVKAIMEADLPFDVIAGVSAGSIMGGLFAMGLEGDAVLQKTLAARNPLDYTFPVHSLTSGFNWTKSMRYLFGDVVIEDLWFRYFCLSANLTTAEIVIHEDGSLVHGVRASTAIPGYLPPVYHGGDVLVDGGLFNNFPVDVMKALPEVSIVIAVDVGASRSMQFDHPFDYHISGWRTLWQRINPFSEALELPSIADILMQSISITNLQSAKEALKLVDFYIAPPVQSYSLTDFDKIEEIAGVGYDYMRELITEMRQAGTLAPLDQLQKLQESD